MDADVTRTIRQEDLDNNPELAEQGLKVGDHFPLQDAAEEVVEDEEEKAADDTEAGEESVEDEEVAE